MIRKIVKLRPLLVVGAVLALLGGGFAVYATNPVRANQPAGVSIAPKQTTAKEKKVLSVQTETIQAEQPTAQDPTTTPTQTGTPAGSKPTTGAAKPPATPAKPGITPPAIQPPKHTQPLLINSITISVAGRCQPSFIHYNYEFNMGGPGTTLKVQWEYEHTSGDPVSPPPIPQSAPLNDYPVGYGTRLIYDGPPAYNQHFGIHSSYGYRVRLHATTPNSIYSNWIDVPRGGDPSCWPS